MITKEALHKKSPQEITKLLYEACINNLEESKTAILEKNFGKANDRLQKANDIIEKLGRGLNYDAGIIADQLEAIYNYLSDCLIRANTNKDISKVEEVQTIIADLSVAWSQALQKNKDIQSKSVKQKAIAYEQNSIYEK
ncbi:flagellar export chaperone FliS [Alkalihalobacillus sp. MEB203]|uniref:Flagellar secretion chaperone FliS n=1 Tax=Alkalihalobacterium chitinilyticum TaxID=2980103 RepID=A0ABT5V9Q7_9BACI|nr:flagellar export chaperone FliS [Alkalihalobacterium chitinilyticum]